MKKLFNKCETIADIEKTNEILLYKYKIINTKYKIINKLEIFTNYLINLIFLQNVKKII